MRRVKETIGRTIEMIGLAAAMLGAASMDSPDLRYPAAIMVTGMILLAIGMRVAPIAPEDLCDDWDWDN